MIPARVIAASAFVVCLCVALPATAQEALVIHGAPRSYNVISLAVPETLSPNASVTVELFPQGGYVLLGKQRRSLPAGAVRRFPVTIGIPANAVAGRATAVRAVFSVKGRAADTISIFADVAEVRKLSLLTRTQLMAQTGGQISVTYEIVNHGNVRETVDATLSLPHGWAGRLEHDGLVVDPGQSLTRTVRVSVPRRSTTGSFFLPLSLTRNGETVSSTSVAVDIIDSSTPGSGTGPSVSVATASTSDADRLEDGVLSLAVQGPLFDSVRIDGRISYWPSMNTAAAHVLSRIGNHRATPYVAFSTRTARLAMGAAGTTFSELTGMYPYGHGAALEIERPRWGLRALGAASVPSAEQGARQPLLGIRGEVQAGPARFSSTVSHLSDGNRSGRRLDAVGAGVAVTLPFESVLRTEMAHRSYVGGRGYGWSTELERKDLRNSAALRVMHAPGGSDAFARASNEVIGSVTQQLSSRASAGASAWRSSDATQVFQSVRSEGWSVRPEYVLVRSARIALEAGTSDFRVVERRVGSSTSAEFANSERRIGVSMSGAVGRFHANGSASYGDFSRSVGGSSERSSVARSPKIVWTALGGWSGERGSIGFNGYLEEVRDASGRVRRHGSLGVRADQVRLPVISSIRAEGEIQHLTGQSKGDAMLLRGGLSIPLTHALAFKVHAERNPMSLLSDRREKWIFTARFERTMQLPMLRAPGSSGFVYKDLNRNRRRDRNEPGLAGAVVRRGRDAAVTNTHGKYRLGGDLRQRATLDDASVPHGWKPVESGSDDIGLEPAAGADVRLVVGKRSGIEDVQVDLSRARVKARDSVGREWLSRMSGPSTATFDELPAGHYELVFDLADVPERLVVAENPRLTVVAEARSVLTVNLIPRPLRMWTPSEVQGGSSSGGSSPGGSAPKFPDAPHMPPMAPSGTRE